MTSPEAVVQVFCKNLRRTHRKTPMLESLFNKASRLQACKFIKKRLRDRCLFSCESCEIFKNTYFGEHLRTAAFAYQILHSVKQHCRIRRRIQLKDKRKKIPFESESFKSKLTLHSLTLFTFAYMKGCEIIAFSNLLFSLIMYV